MWQAGCEGGSVIEHVRLPALGAPQLLLEGVDVVPELQDVLLLLREGVLLPFHHVLHGIKTAPSPRSAPPSLITASPSSITASPRPRQQTDSSRTRRCNTGESTKYSEPRTARPVPPAALGAIEPCLAATGQGPGAGAAPGGGRVRQRSLRCAEGHRPPPHTPTDSRQPPALMHRQRHRQSVTLFQPYGPYGPYGPPQGVAIG